MSKIPRLVSRYRLTISLFTLALLAMIFAFPVFAAEGAITDAGLTLSDVLTITGAVAGAAVITGVIQLLKGVITEGHEKSAALVLSAALVILAFVDQNAYTLPAGFEAFLAWLAIAKGATGIYDEFARKPSALTTPS